MKKFFVSFGFIVIFVANAFYQHISGVDANLVAPNFATVPQNTNKKLSSSLSKTATLAKTNSVTVTQNTSISAPTPATSQGKYRDGTYTGSAANASYGTVQVAAVITSGKLSDIKFLNYPSDRQHSMQLSSYVLPVLRQEAIAIQSEKVNTVSGASYTSAAFKESLSSALSQAI